jgi:hypothetical protein
MIATTARARRAVSCTDRRESRVDRKLPPGSTSDPLDGRRLPEPLVQQIREPARRESIDRAANVFTLSRRGVGTSSLPPTIGHALASSDCSALFAETCELVSDLLAANRHLVLPRALEQVDVSDLLITDDLGYAQQEPRHIEALLTARASSRQDGRRSADATTGRVMEAGAGSARRATHVKKATVNAPHGCAAPREAALAAQPWITASPTPPRAPRRSDRTARSDSSLRCTNANWSRAGRSTVRHERRMNLRATEQSDQIFKNPTVTALAIDEIAHEFAVPNFRSEQTNDRTEGGAGPLAGRGEEDQVTLDARLTLAVASATAPAQSPSAAFTLGPSTGKNGCRSPADLVVVDHQP